MYKICVFAGTSEGRKLVEFLSRQPVSVTVCVATEYGAELLPSHNNISVLAGRLTADEISELFAANAFHLVIDATHPYASAVTESISQACHVTGTEYLRLLREESEMPQDAVYVSDMEAAIEYLNNTEGNILFTTGSKELDRVKRLAYFEERVYARILPVDASLKACQDAGLKAAHIIAVQGPFSEEMNLAMLHFISASWLLTKDGGEAGGFEAKVSAAKKAGVRLVVIGRPFERNGVSFAETVDLLCTKFGCRCRPYVTVAGIGPGSQEHMTRAVRQAIEHSDCVIGARRMLEAAEVHGKSVCDAILATDIAEFIRSHPEYQRFAVVMSGDAGFFSGTRKLLPLLDFCETEVLPGISSLVYLCNCMQISYEEVVVTSVHGREHNLLPDIRANRRVFVLTGGENGIYSLCQTLLDAGLEHVQITVGERLSYPDERLTQGTPQELLEGHYDKLSVALIENRSPDTVVTHGLPDSMFQRICGSDGIVPMTKSEIRAICLSKLRLTEYAVCWDIGAGTGSVAIEMALQAKKGQIYAIERKPAALELLQVNKERFCVDNMTIVGGCAPEICNALPAPDAVFIGGSSGNMREILQLLLEKNPNIRIVATAISLESITELTGCIREFPFTETEVVSIQIAADKKAGDYHLMAGQNPIYVFTMQAGGKH